MNANEIFLQIVKTLNHKPTKGQNEFYVRISKFLLFEGERAGFLLLGYAGTGKTTAIASLVKILPALKLKSVLLAPTGRAAKILSTYAEKAAFTIHKKIYMKNEDTEGNMYFELAENRHTNTVFIVDEASMIGGSDILGIGSRNLLNDLINYIYSGKNCKLIFVGDNAQLPPVGSAISPALDLDYLRGKYNLIIGQTILQDVVRQNLNSGILYNATKLRYQLTGNTFSYPEIETKPYKDIAKITGYELNDALDIAIGNYGTENVIVINRSNKRANIFNQEIRKRILWMEEEIAAGDLMMVVKNNYYWLNEKSSAGFMANGDTIEVLKIIKIEEIYGFRFADAVIRIVDYPNEPEMEVKLILDSIMVEAPSLSKEKMKLLYHSIAEDYADIKNAKEKRELIFNSPYFNALQVKFAYSVTCHKSQGGQWPVVFIDQGYLTEEMLNREYLRWLYTAITRATKQVFLVNFSKEFFKE